MKSFGVTLTRSLFSCQASIIISDIFELFRQTYSKFFHHIIPMVFLSLKIHILLKYNGIIKKNAFASNEAFGGPAIVSGAILN